MNPESSPSGPTRDYQPEARGSCPTSKGQVFTPTEAELAWASRVVQAFEQAERQGLAAGAVEGQMLDYPVVEKARRLLARRAPAAV